MRCYFQLEVNIRTSEFRPQINVKGDQKEAAPLVPRCRRRPGLKPALQDEQVRSHHLQEARTQAGELISVQQLSLRLLIHTSQCRRSTKNKPETHKKLTHLIFHGKLVQGWTLNPVVLTPSFSSDKSGSGQRVKGRDGLITPTDKSKNLFCHSFQPREKICFTKD